MSKKTSEARMNAFFTALAETGNQTISAERARVSRSWVSLHRSTDPKFKVRMEGAIVAAREALRAAPGDVGKNKPDRKWRSIDGEELVIRGSNGRIAQISRARLKQWTSRTEARFLSVLEQTCNVKLACETVGMTAASAYGHRNRWHGFARAWDAAVETGHLSVETALLENACISLDPECARQEPAMPMPPMTAEQAIRLLGLHRARVAGSGKLPGRQGRRVSDDEVDEALLERMKKLYAIKLGRRRVAARMGLPVPEDNIGVFLPGGVVPDDLV